MSVGLHGVISMAEYIIHYCVITTTDSWSFQMAMNEQDKYYAIMTTIWWHDRNSRTIFDISC